MSLHKEIEFEDEICQQLSAHGWLYGEKDAADYDRQLALFPADVLTWVQDTRPDAWEVLTKNHGVAAGQTLLNRLRDSLNQSDCRNVTRRQHSNMSKLLPTAKNVSRYPSDQDVSPTTST